MAATAAVGIQEERQVSEHVTLAEYMRTSYRPDREYIDGEVRERNMGKWEHARIQNILASWFFTHEAEWGVMSATEWRSLVSATRVRIPDLVLVANGPQPDVLVDAPMLVVEILSPDDTYTDTQERASDYRKMGVGTVWIVDPKTRSGRQCVGDVWTAAERLTVPGTQIYVELAELFRELDRFRLIS